jgi:transketolase
MRQQFAKTVMDIMDKDDKVVVLLGDIGVFAFRDVMRKYPTRCYNVGICEQSMVGMAAGLAIAGFIPIVHTIEPFLVERAFEQIDDDFGYQELIGTIVGVDVSESAPNLGYTHQCPFALEMMSKVKNMLVFSPKNAYDFDFLLKKEYNKGLNYFRIS